MSFAKPVQMPRERDLRLLRWVAARRRKLDQVQASMVTSMLRALEVGAKRELSSKQRHFVGGLARGLDDSVNWEDPDCLVDPTERNAGVPSGRPVETPDVLRVLPLRPPGRR